MQRLELILLVSDTAKNDKEFDSLHNSVTTFTANIQKTTYKLITMPNSYKHIHTDHNFNVKRVARVTQSIQASLSNHIA